MSCTKKCQYDAECCVLCDCRDKCKLKCTELCDVIKQAAEKVIFNHKAASLIKTLESLMKEHGVELLETDGFKVIAAGKEK